MEPLIYTSSFVCDQIAERHIRQFKVAHQHSLDLIKDIIAPFGKTLKGNKTRHGALKEITRSICKRLNKEESIISVVAESLNPRFSTHESYSINCIMAFSVDAEQCVDFNAVHILLTRREMTITISEIDFRIHKHALSRFMQREHKPLKEFFNSSIEPMMLSSVVSTGCCFADVQTNNIALPMGEGLLLGKFDIFDYDDNPSVMCKMIFNQSGADIKYLQLQANLIQGKRIKNTMLTYVDNEGMSDSRKSIYDMLIQFADTEEELLNYLFTITYFSEKETDVRNIDIIKKLVTNAYQIAKSNDWKYFEKTARKLTPNAV